MALEGSIKDFGLTDIFQLINLQKKSGILTVNRADTSATINFDKGQIVHAVSTMREDTDKIEIPEGSLKEALQIQIKDVIFQILRWKDGQYRFDAKDIEYENECQVSVPIDFILMEGIRMVDEWPYIESIIPSDDIVFSQCYKRDETNTLFASLSQGEMSVFNLIDGKRDVKSIIDLTQFSEFEAYKILATLQVSGLISATSTTDTTPNKVEVAIDRDAGDKKRLWTALQIAILTFIVSFILLLLPVREMVGVNEILLSSGALKSNAVKGELSYLHTAIRYYYLTNGIFPDSLELLHSEGYLKKGFMTDPWGNLFVYEKHNPPAPSVNLEKGGLGMAYRLYSKGPDRLTGTQDDIF